MEFSPLFNMHHFLAVEKDERGTFVRIYHKICRSREADADAAVNKSDQSTHCQSDMICKIFPCLGGCCAVEKVALELIGVMLLWCFQTR
jgi:hypothetical protein